MKKILLSILVLVFVTALVLIFVKRVKIFGAYDLWHRERVLPQAQPYNQALTNSEIKETPKEPAAPVLITNTSTENNLPSTEVEVKNTLPEEINLAVPFVSQAPSKNWDAVHEETCEEASALMVNGFYQEKKYSRLQMEEELQKIIAWEKENLGFFEDTTAEETARMMRELFGLKGAVVIYDITIEDIKKELAAGRPVIIPAAGKILPNPYFSNGGPLYHTLVLKGYTKDGKFISNDPGTNTLGENFTYDFEALYKAAHDWVPGGDILTGRKAMIVVR